MNEKRFFHNALESDLLSGIKQKRSLDAALGRTQMKASVQTRTNEEHADGMPRWAYIPVIAVLLVLTLAIGSVVFSHGLGTDHRQAGQPIADQTPVEAPKQVVLSNSAEIRLLSEIDAAQQFTETREGFSALPAYNEADWGWLKEMTVRVNDLSATASSISWKTELRISKRDHAENPFLTLADVTYGIPLCFFRADSGLDTPDTGAQLVEYMLPGEIVYTEDDDNWIVLIPEVCAMPQVYDRFPAALPPTGEVTIKNTIFVLDREAAAISSDYLPFTLGSGEVEEYPVSILGTIEHTFTFDAEVLLNIAESVHIDVPLSGECILSIHENNGFHNERIPLDGVTLDAEVHYTVEGVVVILSIKDAGGLSDVEQESLYLALLGGPGGGGSRDFGASATGDIRIYSPYQVWRLSRAFWGTTRFARFLIWIDPSEYAKAEGLGCTIVTAYATGKAGDAPRDDWSWTGADGTLPELTYSYAQLASFEIPLPNDDEPQPETGAVPEAVSSPAVPQNENIFVPDVFSPAPTPELP